MVLRELLDRSHTPAPPELIEMPDPTTKLEEILVRRINVCGVYPPAGRKILCPAFLARGRETAPIPCGRGWEI